MKKRFAAMAMALFLLLSLPLGVRGVDHGRKCSLTVRMEWRGTPLDGGSLTLFQVGTVENGEFVLLPELEDCEMEPEVLERMAEEKQLPGITQSVQRGSVRFADLEQGLYLVTQKEPCRGYYPINAFLISLPAVEGEWQLYDLESHPKAAPNPDYTEPTQPDETKPDETKPDETKPDETKPNETVPKETQPTKPTLPQTGQLNWPVPVMAAAGLVLFALGFWLCFGKKRDYES